MPLNHKSFKEAFSCRSQGLIPNIFKLFPEILRFSILQFKVPPLIQERATLSQGEARLIKSAVKTRAGQGYCFSEILLSLALQKKIVPKGIVSALGYHQGHAKSRVWVDRKNIEQLKLENKINGSGYYPWAISSRVKTKAGDWMHIPLMDFHIEKSPYALNVVVAVGTEIFEDSFLILESDRSYHGVGLKLLPEIEFSRFLSKAILFSPVVDYSYVAHQLLEGEAALRVTKKTWNGIPPKVICLSRGRKLFRL